MRIRIFLTDNHAIFLSGLIKILSAEEDMEVVGTAHTVKETVDKLAQTKVDFLITDFKLADGDGLALVQLLKRKYAKLRIIVLSMRDEAHLVKEVLKENVDGYILKKDSHNELTYAIRSVMQNKLYLSNDVNSMLVRGLHGGDEPK